MIPVPFAGQTSVLQKPEIMTDHECVPLPVWRDGKQVISCWRPSWREIVSIVIFRRVWVGVLSGVTQPPIWIGGQKTVFGKGDGK